VISYFCLENDLKILICFGLLIFFYGGLAVALLVIVRNTVRSFPPCSLPFPHLNGSELFISALNVFRLCEMILLKKMSFEQAYCCPFRRQ
jgi:hypothetical protein